MSERVLVYGLAVAGRATAKALIDRGIDVVAVDDRDSSELRQFGSSLGLDIEFAPSAARLEELVRSSGTIAPAPGVPESHAVIELARSLDRRVVTELDLAYEWEADRPGGPRPIIAVTGTDGKTTTTLLAAAMLQASGRRTVACGNTEVPMVAALDLDVDSFVVEATSFRLAFCTTFRAEASAWLNLAPDHLDWHTSLATYESAKARIWSAVRATDTAIGWVGDPVVMRHLGRAACRRVTFGRERADYSVVDATLHGPRGPIAPVSSMSRCLPHDVTNALCASALVLESGLGEMHGVVNALGSFAAPHHRIEFVAEADGIRWFDDSKATTPNAVKTALRGFEDVVLIAGGRNKGLDLAEIATEAPRLRAVVAIGDASDEVVAAFSGIRPVQRATSMSEAVTIARSLAGTGDTVLLSPGCTSFDWYDGYARRGDDFARCVRELIGASS